MMSGSFPKIPLSKLWICLNLWQQLKQKTIVERSSSPSQSYSTHILDWLMNYNVNLLYIHFNASLLKLQYDLLRISRLPVMLLPLYMRNVESGCKT